MASVLDGLREREPRREALKTRLAELANVRDFSAADGEWLERHVHEKLADWRSLLWDVPQEARHVLRVLLTDRLTFEPTEKDGHRLYRYRGTFTVGALLPARCVPQMLASPRGFDPFSVIGSVTSRRPVAND